MFPWIPWAKCGKWSKCREGYGNLQFIASWSEARVTTRACNWHLKWGQSCWTSPQPVGSAPPSQNQYYNWIVGHPPGIQSVGENCLMWGENPHIDIKSEVSVYKSQSPFTSHAFCLPAISIAVIWLHVYPVHQPHSQSCTPTRLQVSTLNTSSRSSPPREQSMPPFLNKHRQHFSAKARECLLVAWSKSQLGHWLAECSTWEN